MSGYRASPVRFIGGALLAAALSGPIAMMLMLAWAMAATLPRSPGELGFLPVVLLFALPIGFVVSLLPNVFAAMALAHLGIKRRATRHPLLWAASGLALGTLIGALWIGGEPGGMAWLGATGTCCALICRWRARWFD